MHVLTAAVSHNSEKNWKNCQLQLVIAAITWLDMGVRENVTMLQFTALVHLPPIAQRVTNDSSFVTVPMNHTEEYSSGPADEREITTCFLDYQRDSCISTPDMSSAYLKASKQEMKISWVLHSNQDFVVEWM